VTSIGSGGGDERRVKLWLAETAGKVQCFSFKEFMHVGLWNGGGE